VNGPDEAVDAARPRRFATTRWSVVLAAAARSQHSDEALTTLCQIYWYPLYAYVRRRGHDVADAEDLVQAFFMRMLERDALRLADPERGRFRPFLLVSLKHFLINEYDRAHAAKRGGGIPALHLDFAMGEGRYALEPQDALDPERLFERRWALTVMQRVHVRLRSVCARAGKRALFEALKDYVASDGENIPYREAAATLGMSEGAVRVAVHRLRRRFRDLLREEIEETVSDRADVDEELRFLLVTLSDVRLAPIAPRMNRPPGATSD
jgi:RNA polymerase sigma factor (sigma-70 family)